MTTEHRHAHVAIVGVACRLPGAPNLDSFWKMLVEERDAVTEIPAKRFDVDTWYDPTPGRPGRIPSRDGGFLDEIDMFDATFFGMSPYEAMRIDPQQRLLLETACESLDDAGIPADSLAGSDTAVYTAVPFKGYWDMLRAAGMYDPHAGLSVEPAGTAAGLLSYQLDLRGPSMGVQATCATGLVAVHLACRALSSGDAGLAIVAGSTLQLTPDSHLSEAELLSPAGRCRFGDATADGFVKSEGTIVLVLKPLSAALADGDQIYATLLGSTAANSGRSGGSLLGPGLEGQETMLRAAYRDAGVAPGDVDYVEAHGTGTQVGDFTELTALSRIVGEGRAAGRRCLVGSVKSNIGHLEVSAGLAGLLKTSLAIRHRTIPGTLHVREHNPVMYQPGTAVELVEHTRPWPDSGRPALAGVSAFGLSGMNAHIVLTEPPPIARPEPPHQRPSAYLVPVSAHEPAALRALAGRHADALEGPEKQLRDVCFSAGARRTHHEHRIAVVGTDRPSLAEGLRAVRSGSPSRSVIRGVHGVSAGPRTVFVFPGQGAQWVGMGRELLAENEVFAERMQECDAAVQAERGWSPVRLLKSDEPLVGVEFVQPTLWAMQVALASVWRHWGIEPDLVVGHSMGEIAAAATTGAMTVREAAAVVCRRSALLAHLPERGAMWVVRLGEQAAQESIGEFADTVCVGVINSDRSTVLSGDPAALRKVVDPLRAAGVYCQQVQVDYASHSPQVDPIREDLLAALSGVRPRSGDIPMFSTVRDRLVDGAELNASYWADNLRLPVRFASAMCSVLMEHRDTLFIEISPHPLLRTAIEDAAEACEARATVIPSLLRGEPETLTLLTGLATAYVEGCSPRWDRLNEGGRFVPLPHYPWQRRRFWVGSATGRNVTPGPLYGPHVSPAPMPEPYATGEADQPEFRMAVLETRSVDELVRYLVDLVAETLALAPHEIDPNASLTLHGVNSLFAARLQARVAQDLGLRVRAGDLLTTRSLSQLAGDLYAKVGAQEV